MPVRRDDEIEEFFGGRVMSEESGNRVWVGLDLRIWNTLDQDGPMRSKSLWMVLGCRDERKLVSVRLAYLRLWGRVEFGPGRSWSAVPKAKWPVEMPQVEQKCRMSEGEREAIEEQLIWAERVLTEKREREKLRGWMAAQ